MKIDSRYSLLIIGSIIVVLLGINPFSIPVNFLFIAAAVITAFLSFRKNRINGLFAGLLFSFTYYAVNEIILLDFIINTAVLAVFAVLGDKLKLLKKEETKKYGLSEEKVFLGKIVNSLMLAHDMLWDIKKGLPKKDIRGLFAGNIKNSSDVEMVWIYEKTDTDGEMKLAYESDKSSVPPPEILKAAELKGKFLKNLNVSSVGILNRKPPGYCVIVPVKENNEIKEIVILFRKNEFDHSDIYIAEFFSAQVFVILEKNGLYDRLKENYEKTIEALALAIDTKDHETPGHSMDTMGFAVKIAERMNLDEKEKEKIKYASLLHDIGKINISGAILNKPGPLTREEYEEIKKHSGKGAEILGKMDRFEEIIPIIFHHHERFDGNGYPYSLKGNNIPIGSRICAVADAYSVMRSDRPYRGKMPEKAAVEELKKHAGTQFDKKVVDVFLDILKEEGKADPVSRNKD